MKSIFDALTKKNAEKNAHCFDVSANLCLSSFSYNN
jgi:hypothetical protein